MKLAAATILPGAKGRLLPPSIPFAFFTAALVFHVLLWAVVIYAASDVASFRGGLGHPLGALHVLTLGVLTSTAMGAALQLLPVATRQPLAALWPARATFWLFAPGTILLVHGMGEGNAMALAAGGIAAASGLGLFAILVADNLRRAPSLGAVGLHAWVAHGALALLLAGGLALAFDFSAGVLRDHAAVALAHGLLGLYGFMGTLALGFSYILVPMFALAEAVPNRWSEGTLALWTVALVLAIVGALAAFESLVAAGAILGLAAALAHVGGLARVLKRRMRRHLGLSFILLRAGWGALIASLILGGLAALGWLGPRGPALFGFVAAFGWLLTFLLGVLQRILPFLGSMHAAKGGRPPLVSELTRERALALHAACHGTALVAIFAGIAADLPEAVRFGGVVGLCGAIAFAWFGASVLHHVFRRPAARQPRDAALMEH
jgi:hypothetical protein